MSATTGPIGARSLTGQWAAISAVEGWAGVFMLDDITLGQACLGAPAGTGAMRWGCVRGCVVALFGRARPDGVDPRVRDPRGSERRGRCPVGPRRSASSFESTFKEGNRK